MLTKEEEYRLAAFLGILRRDIKDGLTQDPDIDLKAYLWLAEKLEEVNNSICRCPRNLFGDIAVLHKCKKCGYEGRFDDVHTRCEGCGYK